mmetsp:Transcript_8914/g.19613  ORF Transcript_8914/g.19613 Transcript_8914/m.19613 type:complete len:219 (+) Transcript_8914:69-725(+)
MAIDLKFLIAGERVKAAREIVRHVALPGERQSPPALPGSMGTVRSNNGTDSMEVDWDDIWQKTEVGYSDLDAVPASPGKYFVVLKVQVYASEPKSGAAGSAGSSGSWRPKMVGFVPAGHSLCVVEVRDTVKEVHGRIVRPYKGWLLLLRRTDGVRVATPVEELEPSAAEALAQGDAVLSAFLQHRRHLRYSNPQELSEQEERGKPTTSCMALTVPYAT